LNPNLASAHSWYAYWLGLMGRPDEAARAAVAARRADPLYSSVALGVAFILARRFDEAIAEMRRVTELQPEFAGGYGNLGRALVNAGRFAEAIPVLERALALQSSVVSRGWLGYALAKTGDGARARAQLAEIEQLAEARNSSNAIAWIHLGLGNTEQAVAAMVAAVDAHAVNPGFIAEPVWDPIRGHPAFQRMRQRVGLP
jgi:tetratricopeptide (TPR) repeat protein